MAKTIKVKIKPGMGGTKLSTIGIPTLFTLMDNALTDEVSVDNSSWRIVGTDDSQIELDIAAVTEKTWANSVLNDLAGKTLYAKNGENVYTVSIVQGTLVPVNIAFDWNGIIGTGQSLSVGAQATTSLTNTQPFNNLKLSLGGLIVPPYDYNSTNLSMIPLKEPIRSFASGYPAPYPNNIYGETHHSSMANQLTSLVEDNACQDYITAHTVVGESGQGMSVIKKGATDTGTTGRAYAASIFEVNAIKRLAQEAGKTYGVGAIILTHGETDAGNTNYKSELHTLWSDYNQDIKAITGQTQDIPIILTQQHSCGETGTSESTIAQWKAALDYPGDIICAGPNYYYPYVSDALHLTSSGYKQLGEKYAKVYYEKVILGNDWQPLQPTSVEATGKVITVNFHVPVAPLVWDTELPEPHQSSMTEWSKGKGFEVIASNGARVAINSVEISGDSVLITCVNNVPYGAKVAYAYTGNTKRANGTYRWGLLKDSDPFVGYATSIAQPNYCVSFVENITMK